MSTSTVNAVPTSPLSSSFCGPRPLQLLDNNVSSVLDSPTSLSSPRALSSLGLSTPPPTARSFKSGNTRRQSSISYFPSDHLSSPTCRSPTFASHRPSPRRSSSVGVWDNDGAGVISRMKGDRRSLGQSTAGKQPLSPGPAADHGPLTLTEKHADLLQFIAQKEAKCLELRSQLAAHEAELSQLKRKWEKIVSRGMDRAYSSPGSPAPSAPSSAVSSIIPTASAAIKEGARLLAAGLDLSAPDSNTSTPIVPIPGLTTVSRASLASPAVRRVVSRHEATHSMSSVSTASSSTRASTAQSSQRLSQSSASSLMTALSLEDPAEESSVADALLEGHTLINAPMEAEQPQQLFRRRSQDGDTQAPISSATSSMMGSTARKSSIVPNPPKSKVRPTSTVFTNSSTSSPSSPVSNWVGSMGSTVGRKWEEIQKGEAFTKSQKRASLLLSDVSQSLFATLASPSPSAGASPLIRPSPLSSVTVSSSPSLLDDEPEQLEAAESSLGAVLVPSRVSPSQVEIPKPNFDDDEDWNW